jgi:GT2 family glycosyltransferase
MLSSSDPSRPAWATFDQKWYLQTYCDADKRCNGNIAVALNDYLSIGMMQGHSPSPMFDEKYYLDKNPELTDLIRQGLYVSGFDHFCQHGHRVLSPHWLFDDQHYQRLYDDMSLENLDYHGCAGRYDHYLKSGQFEGRQGHYLFDPMFYRQQAIAHDIRETDIDKVGPFVHYLYLLSGKLKELSPSIYFDANWYVQSDVRIRLALERGEYNSAIQHYLSAENSKLFDPVPEYSESYYVESNPDINTAVNQGKFRCGYEHFIQFGTFEFRRPHSKIDMMYYRDMNPCTSEDLNSGKIRDVFAHLRLIGIPGGLSYKNINTIVEINEEAGRSNFKNKARQNAVLFTGQKLNFYAVQPVISVIMVAFNKFELTMLSLASLRENFAGEVELILLDNGSSDQTKNIDRYIFGAKILHIDENIGFIEAANRGLPNATAPAILYLNNDIELGFGAISSALKTLYSSSDIGAVGGKIIRSHGKLQEAGSIIWRDGTAQGYMRNEQPLRCEVNFLREVDYCSAVFLLCRGNLLKQLNGFDSDFSPAYYEDSDLCVRLDKAGFRVIYDPKIIVYHLEFGSAETSSSSATLMKRGQKIFFEKHTDYLNKKFPNDRKKIINARCNNQRKKILFFEDTVPLRHLGSGFVRANDIVEAIVQAGHDVSIFPLNGISQDIMLILSGFSDRIEVLYDFDFTYISEFLTDRSEYYDLIWVSRTHNLARILPELRKARVFPPSTPIVLDSEAIVTVRDHCRFSLLQDTTSEEFNFEQKLKDEFNHTRVCSHITAVSEAEHGLLKSIDLPNVSLLGTICTLKVTTKSFSDRQGILFVGSIHRDDSPNLDSLYWLQDKIIPFLKCEMKDLPIFNFVGFIEDKVDLSNFSSDQNIRILGPVDDLSPYYDANRVFVAPTRFAAGTPYKVYEAASFGLPCVATDLLVEQLGWQSGVELLSASVKDPKRFASQLANLYQNEALWSQLRSNAIRRVETENDAASFNLRVQSILKDAMTHSKNSPSSIGGKRRTARNPVPI